MKYIKVKWLRPGPKPSVWIYSELNGRRYETRKIKLYDDGHCGYASETEEVGGAGLGTDPVPPLAELASDQHFEPHEITKEEFEQVWAKVRAGKS